ncbi:hypothetical protein CH063_03445 [Colletotrichum higginsianum]|nr:hypothetical protein CH063_03445 [Colletotrichum higginsianum]
MAESSVDHVASDAKDALDCPVVYGELNCSRITPDKPNNFTLKKNASDITANVDWLNCSMVVDEPLNARDNHLCAFDQVPEAKTVYKPGV